MTAGTPLRQIYKHISSIHSMLIDLSSFIPEKISGFEVFVKEDLHGEPSLLVYYHQNRVKPIRIKRFVNSKILGGMLGQYQAEGTKNAKTKNGIEFCNKLILEHCDFIEGLGEIGFQREQLTMEASFRYDYDGSKKAVEFEKGTGFKIKHTIIAKFQKGKYGFRTKVVSTNFSRLFTNLALFALLHNCDMIAYALQ